ncbi:membrane protein [Agaricicola taiwanensis]|uniref:Membrane protein n=1 Tax=Agaricicola taiwanensis TaxID=591372 RepID=A0A8J2YM18_9RHOB|nr:DUF4105 domain-containing protein [Agaricicola taiwanensis]GGE52174.1 membrane protein [Agaricicola taiwanensis]
MRLALYLGVLTVAVLLAAGGIWFQSAGLIRILLLSGLVLLSLALIVLALKRHRTDRRLPWIALLLVILLGALWWSTIRPRGDRAWAPDVAHGLTAEIAGETVTLHNVRNFEWRSETDFTERWETWTLSLDELDSVDLFTSNWGLAPISHTLLSFGFRDGRHLVFSAEVRRERDEEFSEIGGFFKMFELVMIGAAEGDIIRLRTNIRREEVSLYPIRMNAEQRRALFLTFLERANELAREPAFYQTITTNCTTVIFQLARTVDPGLPFDWRIILSGYLPGYLYDLEAIPTDAPLDEVERRAAISARGQAAGNAADFSARIRGDTRQP